MAWYSKHDRTIRRFVPSIAKISYNPFIKIIGNTVAWILSRPFPELRELPPNHLCIRTGSGNQLFNNHVIFIMKSGRCWLNFLSRRYCTSSSDVVELGCGCGGIARALKEAWFEGTYVGVDIDEETIAYCRKNFPTGRFEFILSPHRSKTYRPARGVISKSSELVIAKPDSKDFVFSISLYSHLLEEEVIEYMRETHRILRSDGIMYLTFFCIEHVERGQRFTFNHRRGNAYFESARYPEAAISYNEAFMTAVAAKCGFREITVARSEGVQSELVARK